MCSFSGLQGEGWFDPWLLLKALRQKNIILLCSFSGLQGEGWFDPWLLLKALRQKNINNEVLYAKGEVVGFTKTILPASRTGLEEDKQDLTFVEVCYSILNYVDICYTDDIKKMVFKDIYVLFSSDKLTLEKVTK